jgi:hypothetical protein
VHVEFDPGVGVPPFGSVPFPSDLQLDAAGHVDLSAGLERIAGNNVSVIRDGLLGTAGFARQGSGVFFVDGALDPSTLPRIATMDAHASVALVDVDPTSRHRGQRYPVRAVWLPSVGCIAVAARPGVVLPPGVRHALVVTTRVLDATSVPIGASPELRRIAALRATQRTSRAESLYGEALDALVKLAIVRRSDEVAGLAVFTTSRAWEELYTLRARLRGGEFAAPVALWDARQAAPNHIAVFGVSSTPNLDAWLGTAPRDADGQEWPGGDDPAGIAHDAIGAVANFAMTAPSFLDASTHHFEHDETGAVRLATPSEVVPVTLLVPKAPAPPGGYPVVVYGHGLSNDRGSMLSNGNELARAGFAVIGIDDVLQGTREGLADLKNRFPGTYRGPDGIPDALPFAVAFLGGFTDFLATRDNFRQTVLDEVTLIRLVQNPALDLRPLAVALGGPTPKLDGRRIVWSGGSLGGIVGSMTASIEPEIRAAALQVPGAGFVPFVASGSAKLAPLIESIAKSNFALVGSEVLDELHPLGLLLGQITEAGDPLAYAGALYGDRPPGVKDLRRPHLLVTYTVDDEVLPNIATHALLRTIGIPIVGPTLLEPEAITLLDAPVSGNVGGLTAAALQYAPSTHALGYNRWDVRQFEPGLPASDPARRFPMLPQEIRIELPIREQSRQLVRFLTEALAGTPEITVAAPVLRDFDADGVDDAAERAAGTDPWDPASH